MGGVLEIVRHRGRRLTLRGVGAAASKSLQRLGQARLSARSVIAMEGAPLDRSVQRRYRFEDGRFGLFQGTHG